jgi:hypothetical protein
MSTVADHLSHVVRDQVPACLVLRTIPMAFRVRVVLGLPVPTEE